MKIAVKERLKNPNNAVVLGNGYIGSAFKESGMDCITSSQFRYSNNFEKLFNFGLHKYDVIVNAIGITDTKWSELPENFQEVWSTNVEFVEHLSSYCNLNNIKLVHLSTADLYGNTFDVKQNTEDTTRIDVGTNYRLSKYVSEKFCSPNDLILRIRLPFDGRNHPKNLLAKVPKFTKLYSYVNDYTYIPDLIEATKILVDRNEKGIYNIVSHEDGSVLYLLRNVLELPQFQSYDLHDHSHPNIMRDLSNVHIHNVSSDEKLRRFFIQTPLEEAVKKSWSLLTSAQAVV